MRFAEIRDYFIIRERTLKKKIIKNTVRAEFLEKLQASTDTLRLFDLTKITPAC